MRSLCVNVTYCLFAGTIFLSSFLLFQVQPLISKHILPWFGGGSAVWITAMFFFMLVLALGYGYVLFLTRFKKRIGIALHAVLLLSTLLVLGYHHTFWPSAITPAFNDMELSLNRPVGAVFYLLAVSVGLAFFLLSSTSSLLQLWYGKLSGREPFSLYAVSNAGSLLGLLSYPFFFEPFFPTDIQGRYWAYGVFLYGLTLLLVMCRYGLSPEEKPETLSVPRYKTDRTFFRWLALAALPVATMLSGTSFLTSYVAPVPLLWVLPLALYLISFIVSFRERPRASTVVATSVMLVTIVLALLVLALPARTLPTSFNVLFILAALFSVFHVCHERLYRDRPAISALPIFYIALALGGIVGSLTIMVATLYLFVLPVEFILILSGVGLFFCFGIFSAAHLRGGLTVLQGGRFFISGAGMVVIFITCGVFLYRGEDQLVFQVRNFFGHKAIKEFVWEGKTIRTMMHGLTSHGTEIVSGPGAGEPMAYYGWDSGVGKVFQYLHLGHENKALRVALVGLGGGTLSAYCRPGDHFDFFEVDPQVVFLAERYFSYLDRCPGEQLIVGDARINIERLGDTQAPYDLIVIDAYADDTVPAHLLTVEAARLYAGLLTPDGVLAVHISSRYLDLKPVVAAYESAISFHGRYYIDRDPVFPKYESVWAIFSRDDKTFEREPLSDMISFEGVEPIEWTDVYSSLLPIIRY